MYFIKINILFLARQNYLLLWTMQAELRQKREISSFYLTQKRTEHRKFYKRKIKWIKDKNWAKNTYGAPRTQKLWVRFLGNQPGLPQTVVQPTTAGWKLLCICRYSMVFWLQSLIFDSLKWIAILNVIVLYMYILYVIIVK